MNFGICLLAFGKEHVNECNHLIKSLFEIDKDLDIFVYTNDFDYDIRGNVRRVLTTTEFNYNLKVEAVNFGLLYYDTVLFIDTDTHINKSIKFSLLDNIKQDGFYTTKEPYTVFTHDDEVVSVHSLINNTDYGKEIVKLSGLSNLSFLDEQKFVIRIEDEEKRYEFCQTWKKLFKNTKETHIENKHTGSPGIYEGLIMSTTCKLQNLPIVSDNVNTKSLFNNMSHYGWEIDKPHNPTLI